MSDNTTTLSHANTVDISVLSEDLQKDAPILTVDRIGSTDKSFMRTECYLGFVEPKKNYLLALDGMHETLTEKAAPLGEVVKPPLTVLTGDWQSEVDLTIDDANILGGNGRYLLKEGEDSLKIQIAHTTPEHLAYYGCHLTALGDVVSFESTGNLPLTVTSVGEDYPDGYLLDPNKGGGAYLEVHDRPHFHMPMNAQCAGYLIIGMRNSDDVDEVSAFQIPFGYGLHMAPWAIHSDAYLIGTYMVIYSATPEFSTVIVRKNTGELASIKFVD